MTDHTIESMQRNAAPATAAAPRPPAVFGSSMLALGGVALVLAPYLSWYKIYEHTYNGFSLDPASLSDQQQRGVLYVWFGAALLVGGLVQLCARRVMAVAVASVVVGVLGLVVCLGFLTNAADLQSLLHVPSKKFHWLPGLWVGLGGAMVALAGAVGTLTRRPDAIQRPRDSE